MNTRARTNLLLISVAALSLFTIAKPAESFAQRGYGGGGGGWNRGGFGGYSGFGGYGGSRYGYGYGPNSYGGYYAPYGYRGNAYGGYNYGNGYAYPYQGYSGAYTSGYRGNYSGYVAPETRRTVVPDPRRKGAFLGVNLDKQYPDAAIVQQVFANTSAEKMGLRPGDMITEINGKEVSSWRDVTKITSQMKPGETVKVRVAGSKPRELEGVLGTRA